MMPNEALVCQGSCAPGSWGWSRPLTEVGGTGDLEGRLERPAVGLKPDPQGMEIAAERARI